MRPISTYSRTSIARTRLTLIPPPPPPLTRPKFPFPWPKFHWNLPRLLEFPANSTFHRLESELLGFYVLCPLLEPLLYVVIIVAKRRTPFCFEQRSLQPRSQGPLRLVSRSASWRGLWERCARYVNILTWLRGFLVIFLYLEWFSLCSSLFWELQNNGVVRKDSESSNVGYPKMVKW